MNKSPRFLYFPQIDPHPFALLIHDRFPKKRFTVHWRKNKLGFELNLDKNFGDNCDERKLAGIVRSAEHWLFAQINNGLIHRPFQ